MTRKSWSDVATAEGYEVVAATDLGMVIDWIYIEPFEKC